MNDDFAITLEATGSQGEIDYDVGQVTFTLTDNKAGYFPFLLEISHDGDAWY